MDIVFTAPDLPTLVTAAVAMGFYDATAHQIISVGPIPGGGSWFYNYVGTAYQQTGTNSDGTPIMTALSGVWGRLRHNGDPAYIPALPANSGVTLYTYNQTLGGWTSDGVTLAPGYVGEIGLIA